MANIDWHVLADKTPAVQGGIDGSTNHVGSIVPAVFKLSDLPTSGTAGPKLKIPAGVIPTAWSLYVLKNNLKAGVSSTLTFSGTNISASGTVTGDVDGSDSDSDADPGSGTKEGLLAEGRLATQALNTSDASFVVPTIGTALDPADDGDALVCFALNVEVVDRSKIYLW